MMSQRVPPPAPTPFPIGEGTMREAVLPTPQVNGAPSLGRPLRIAVFVHEFPALSETFVLNHITGLLDLGHDVTIFANGVRDEPTVHPDVERYRLGDRLCYHAMPRSRVRRVLTAPRLMVRRGLAGPLLKALNPRAYGREATSVKEPFGAWEIGPDLGVMPRKISRA